MKKRILSSTYLTADMSSLRGSETTKQSIKKAVIVAALAGVMTLGAPANAEMPVDPTSTDFTHNVFTLNESSASSHSPSYIILYDVNKSTGALTEKYYDFSLNRTNYTYQTGATDISRTINVPNSTLDLTVKYTTSDPRQVEPNPIPADLLIAKQNENDGAAIRMYYSWLSDVEVRNGVFLNNHANQWGGVIETVYGAIGEGIHNSVFIGNDGNPGGVIHNQEYIGGITDSIFIANSSASTGGAINNSGGGEFSPYIGAIKNTAFISNSAATNGGAIYNRGANAQITEITDSTFISNSAATGGGAILNRTSARIGNITNTTFINNSASYGGAILGYSNSIIGDITNTTFINNSANSVYGGAAIYIYSGAQIGDIKNSTFISNNAENGWGGAIRNGGGTIGNITNSTFISNSAGGSGGAIDNYSTIGDIQNTTFVSNSAEETGGAIYNEGTTGNIQNSTFINNTAGTRGGAIWAQNDVNMTSDGGKTIFKGNTDSTGSNAIYMNNATKTVTFDHKNGGKTYMYDVVDGAAGYTVDIKGNGTMYLFNDINNANVSIGGVELNTINNDIHTYNFNSLTLTKDFNMAVDVDLKNQKMDRLTAENYTLNGHKLKVTGMNLMSDATKDKTTIFFADNDLKKNVLNQVSELYTPLYKYDVVYGAKSNGGYYNFNRSFNPSVLASPVAAQIGGMASQWNSYDQAFINMDMNMLYTREERKAMKLQNRYASVATPKVFSETYLPEKDLAGWARPYASFEKVDLRNGPSVNNTMYGMFFGGDSEMYELKHNWDFQYSVYAGYNGSRQSYNDVTILQNGGTLGATGIFYHDNFFTALTANVGASVANADTMFGHEDFPMLMTGVASKTGYNLEMFKGKFIIQPSWLMSYSFVNTFNYKNAAGVRVESDGLHAVQLAPQLKFIGNLPHGWQPYASIQMVWNIMDETKFRANNVSLPYMSIKPYIQYGVGVQKRWGERFTGFFQTMIRNGGRTGVAFTLGFRWALGKDRPKTSAATQRTVIK